MARLPTIYLLLSSLILTLTACKTAKLPITADASCRAVYQQRIHTANYKAGIDFFKKHYSGILVFKEVSDTLKRAVFITETGFKFFDFEFGAHHFSVIFCLPGLSKKMILNIFKRDFGLLLNPRRDKALAIVKNVNTITYTFADENGGRDTYIADTACRQILEIEHRKAGVESFHINISGMKGESFDSVNIKHKHIKLNISLKQIDR